MKAKSQAFNLVLTIVAFATSCGDILAQCPLDSKLVSGGGPLPCNIALDAEVVLEDAQFDVTYVLYKNNVAQTPEKTANEEGVNLVWQVSSTGVYTVKAYSMDCPTPLQMESSAVVTARLTPTAITITPSTNLNYLCEGDPINLSATGASAISWWMKEEEGDHLVNTVNAPGNKYYPLENGIYYAKGMDLNCNTNIRSPDNAVTFWPKPSATVTPATATTICTTCTLQISAPQTHSYIWKKDNITINGAISYSYTVNTPGIYTVDVTEHNCTTTSTPLEITMNEIPSVYAGTDVTLYTPVTSFSRSAQAYDNDGTVSQFQWSKISGPVVTLTNANTSELLLNGLIVGAYTFRMTVTDDLSDVAHDDFVLTVVQLNDNYNFVKEEILTAAGKVTATDVINATLDEKTLSSSYFDGLGRPWQTVRWKASPGQNDIVQPITYDEFGREQTKYLPYTGGTDGKIKTNFIAKDDSQYSTVTSPQYDFYQNGGLITVDAKPYAQTVFEKSPLNRVIEYGNAGAAWQPGTDHTIKKEYVLNDSSEVMLFTYDGATGGINNDGFYGKSTLTCTKTIDEENNDVLEFVDKEGRTVCKKVKAPGNAYACTYYVYDDFGNLVAVIPPEGVQRLLNEN
jgi:hypothetical protein